MLKTNHESRLEEPLKPRSFSAHQDGPVREEEFDGKSYIVVPIAALSEGVLHADNQPDASLVLASEFLNPVEMWNGRPITFAHPTMNGFAVSASQTPGIFQNVSTGFIFNAKAKDKKLLVEAWIDEEKFLSHGEAAKAVVKALKEGSQVEVSTGYFHGSLLQDGELDGKTYKSVDIDIKPDHLAILPLGTKGACSWEDGCGAPRTNKASEGGTLPMPLKRFLAALKGASGLSTKEPPAACPCDGACSDSMKAAIQTLAAVTNETSDQNVKALLEMALKEKGEHWPYVVAFYEDSFVFLGSDDKLYRRGYEIADDSVTLAEESSLVYPKMTFETLPTVNQEGGSPAEENAEMPKTPEEIAAEAAADAEKKKTVVTELEELEPVKMVVAPVEAAQPAAQAAVKPKTPKTAAEYISDAPPELQEVLRSGLKLHEAQRAALISAIKGNERNKFTDETLKAFPTETLENLANLATTADYTGQIGSRPATQTSNEIPAPPKVFEKTVVN